MAWGEVESKSEERRLPLFKGSKIASLARRTVPSIEIETQRKGGACLVYPLAGWGEVVVFVGRADKTGAS